VDPPGDCTAVVIDISFGQQSREGQKCEGDEWDLWFKSRHTREVGLDSNRIIMFCEKNQICDRRYSHDE
jgi:hypothetical protein